MESQNHGSLHLHSLVWLEGAPTSEEMHKLLQEAEFCVCILVYIWANLQASTPGLDSKADVKRTPNETDITYSHPIHPQPIQ
jgi:hypothetical protein